MEPQEGSTLTAGLLFYTIPHNKTTMNLQWTIIKINYKTILLIINYTKKNKTAWNKFNQDMKELGVWTIAQ